MAIDPRHLLNLPIERHLSYKEDGESHPPLRGVSLDAKPGVVGLSLFPNDDNMNKENPFAFHGVGYGFLGGKDLVYHQNVGVYGESDQQGVFGHATAETGGTGVYGDTKRGGFGVRGESTGGVGVQGQGFDDGVGIVGIGGRLAGYFQGDIEVTGDIRLMNADCAEDFDIAGLDQVQPGTVMVIDPEGSLRPSDQAYDKRVAGVISGAGDYKPGIVLDKQQTSNNRMPIALVGKVYCKVDASYGEIEVGDLLTTSPTPGHAMKVSNPLNAFGAVIGKALRPHVEGQGLIPILIALQ